MTGAGRTLAALVGFCALGCATDMAAGGGAMTKTGHAVAFGRIAASTKPASTPMNDRGLMLGMALEGRGEESVGSRFSFGGYVGWATPPNAIFGHFSGELQGEAGTPLQGTLFEDGDLYLGVVAGLPFPLQRKREVSDINASTWILKRRFDLVPFVRVLDHRDGGENFWDRLEVSGGLALRYRVASDLF